MPFGIHYAWVTVAVLAVVQIFGSSIFFVAGIMLPPLSDETGEFRWGVGTIGAAIAVYYLFSAIYAPISGHLGDRFGARPMMLAGIIMYGLGMVALGFVSEVWHFFLFYSVFMSATASITMVPLMASISGWFRRRLGVGIGILWAVGGIGAAILAPLIAYLLDTLGWRETFLGVGIVGSGIMLLLWPLIRSKPADIGIQPYGTSESDPLPVVRSLAVTKLRLKVFNQSIRRTSAFWNLPLIHGLGCAGMGLVLIFGVDFAVKIHGIDLATAAWIISIISLVSIISRLGSPILAEMWGPRKIMAASMLIQGLTIFILFWAQDVWTFYLFAAAFGLGFGAEWTAYLEINRRYFGDGPTGMAYGWQMTGAMVGHAVTTALAGLVIYATGSYILVFALSAAFSFAGVVVVAMLDSTAQVLIPEWEDSLPPEARTLPAQEGGSTPAPAAAGDS